jgi:ATP-dependent DNA ligase
MQLMEAESAAQLPRGAQWQYEPKWDGFRCLLVRDGSQISMQSKSGRDLVRYFPEIASAATTLSPKALTLDGELIVERDGGYSFDALLQRIHPAASRIKRLAAETPAIFIVFDLLRSGKRDLFELPLMKRRAALERLARQAFVVGGVFRLSPASRNVADAEAWLSSVNEDHDGVVAKRLELPYRGGTRDGTMLATLLTCFRCALRIVGGISGATALFVCHRYSPSLLPGP